MKHLMTLLALVVAVTAGAQNSINVYPWNPDYNNDTYIGSDDLMGLLSTYGTQFGLPPEPCDYDGTPFEEFYAGLLTGNIVIDSIFVEYELQDVSTYFPIGCPEQVTDTVTFAYSSLAIETGNGGLNSSSDSYMFHAQDENGYYVYVQFGVDTQTNTYRFKIQTDFLGATGLINDGFFGGNSFSSNWIYSSLPFIDSWFFDENGFHLGGWNSSQWPYYATYMHLWPYWHYVE